MIRGLFIGFHSPQISCISASDVSFMEIMSLDCYPSLPVPARPAYACFCQSYIVVLGFLWRCQGSSAGHDRSAKRKETNSSHLAAFVFVSLHFWTFFGVLSVQFRVFWAELGAKLTPRAQNIITFSGAHKRSLVQCKFPAGLKGWGASPTELGGPLLAQLNTVFNCFNHCVDAVNTA